MPVSIRSPFDRLLDPVDRVTEILFGLIMVLTSTGTLSVLTAGRPEVQTMILGALGCNLAWGIIDGGMYLMACLAERGRDLLMIRAAREAEPEDARRGIADALPEAVGRVVLPEQLEAIRSRLSELPEEAGRARLTATDVLGAVAVALLVFLSTVPVVIPFLFIPDIQPALRVSNAVAIVMLFLCGYAFARCTGHHPWLMGLIMVAVGGVLVGIAIALGG